MPAWVQSCAQPFSCAFLRPGHRCCCSCAPLVLPGTRMPKGFSSIRLVGPLGQLSGEFPLEWLLSRDSVCEVSTLVSMAVVRYVFTLLLPWWAAPWSRALLICGFVCPSPGRRRHLESLLCCRACRCNRFSRLSCLDGLPHTPSPRSIRIWSQKQERLGLRTSGPRCNALQVGPSSWRQQTLEETDSDAVMVCARS